MDNKYFFSVIIPCFNSKRTIDRLLNSLVCQDFPKDEFEVILCDDGHKDNWHKRIDNYKKDLNIIYCETKKHKFKCPGNTRMDALPLASGQWICFVDHDDILATDALSIAKDLIIKNNIKYVLATEPVDLDPHDPNQELYSYGRQITLLHGKFYNKDFLDKYKINFLEDFATHEDLYFNTAVMCALYREGEEAMTWFSDPLYIWVNFPDSLSKSYYKSYKEYEKNYLEANFQDYLTAYAENYLNLWQEEKFTGDEKLKVHLMYSILYAYFYYEGELYHLKEEVSKPELLIAINHIKKIMNICNFTKEDIINYIYKNPVNYAYIRKDIPQTEGPFIEDQSFKDFILTNIK